MTDYPKVGDTLSYTLEEEGVASGVVTAIYTRIPVAFLSILHPGAVAWRAPENAHETVVYRIKTSEDTILVGASRILWDAYAKEKGLE